MSQSNVTHLSSFDRAERTIRPEQPRKKFVAKGHDSQLQDAQYSKAEVRITTMDGIVYRGTISRRDKYTITVNIESIGVDTSAAGFDVIIYKHAIESILIKKVAAAKE